MATVTLSKAVIYNGVTYSALSFREPTIGDFMTAGKFSEGIEENRNIVLLASMAGIPLPAMREVRLADLRNIVAATAHLVGNETSPEPTTGT